MKHFSLFFVCFITVHLLIAQELPEVLENNPPSVKWYRVNTPNFRVLYPKGFEEQAQRMANTLEHIRVEESKSLGVNPRRISIILQNQSSISNGFVSILPKRSEFYTMPPQDYNFGGTNDWLNQLATHEYRHVVQFERANTGFNRLLYYMFGPATLSAMAITAVPQWFWEGDAVATETAFTHSGRGRIPNFGLVLRTNLQEGRVFNYHKQYLRSYKNEISDHYVLGYHMISYLRKRTGDPDIWGKISKRAWSVPFIPFTFSNAIKKESGLYVTQLYREMVKDLQKTWKDEEQSLQITPFETVSKRRVKKYTDYRYPQVLEDGSVLAMKSGIGDIAKYVVLDDGKESKAFVPGIINDGGMLSVSGTKVVWSEFGFDPRWLVKSYSLIKTYDIATKRYATITKKTRYSGASISPDGLSIVTVESATDYKVSVLIINSENGSVIKQFANPSNSFYSMVRWADDGKRIVALKTENGNRSVVIIDSESGKETVVISPSTENIGHPVLYGNYLFYNSPVSGIDNIYVYDLQKQQKLLVTSSKYGAYNAAISNGGKTIYYSEQTRDGLDIVSIPFNPESWKEFIFKDDEQSYSNILSKQEGNPTLFDSIPTKNYEAKKHSKISGIVNPYSWGAYFNSTFTQADIGITSTDILSTTSLKAGYLYDINERTGSWRVGASYQGLYPIIDAQVLFGNRTEKSSAFGNQMKLDWDETSIEVGARIPLILTRSKYHSGFEIGNYVGATRVSSFVNKITNGDSVVYEGPGRFASFIYNPTPDTADIELAYVYKDQLNNGELLYNRFYVTYYRLLKQNRRDINSRFGQVLEYELYSTPFKGDFKGKLWAFRSIFYFPGFANHHSISARINYQVSDQSIDPNLYSFRDRIFRPRGYAFPNDEKFYSFSLNYALPIWYPDIAIGPLLNIQRIKANLFYDYGSGQGTNYFYGVNYPIVLVSYTDAIYKSYGIETTFDINILRFLPKFELGFRVSYITANIYTTSGTTFEFLIGNIGF
jgi:hypothetical protein